MKRASALLLLLTTIATCCTQQGLAHGQEDVAACTESEPSCSSPDAAGAAAKAAATADAETLSSQSTSETGGLSFVNTLKGEIANLICGPATQGTGTDGGPDGATYVSSHNRLPDLDNVYFFPISVNMLLCTIVVAARQIVFT